MFAGDTLDFMGDSEQARDIGMAMVQNLKVLLVVLVIVNVYG